MEKSDVRNGMLVLVNGTGQEGVAVISIRLFGQDQPCLLFSEAGIWRNVEPYVLTDEEIKAFEWDAQGGIIRSPLRL